MLIYQGTELWDFSLVDPDNRRPVDFGIRKLYLSEIQSQPHNLSFILSMVNKSHNGMIKMCIQVNLCSLSVDIMYKLLHLRKNFPDLFKYGSYAPLHAEGPLRDHIIAFSREYLCV